MTGQTTSHQPASAEPPRLHCWQGQPAPAMVVQGWQALLAMPTSAQQAFTQLFTTSIIEENEDALKAMLGEFCQTHQIDQAAAFMALKAVQALFSRAAALDLGVDRFVEDLQQLSKDDLAGVRLLTARFQVIKDQIRQQFFEASLTDHGKVLIGLDWRVDHVSASDRAVGLNAPVVYLTLRTRDAERTERTTLQLTPQSVRLLQSFCERFAQQQG
jgi:hypothetical protein